MGEWGNGIFQNDLASDVKSYTLKLLGDGLDGEATVAEVFRTFEEIGAVEEETRPSLVLALAVTLHSKGFLIEELKKDALQLIEEELGSAPPASRRKHLEKAAQTLNSEQKRPARPKKLVPYIAPFEPGEYLAVEIEPALEALVYVTGKSRPDICGDCGNYVRVLGPVPPDFDPSKEPDIPYLHGNEFENPDRYFSLVLQSRPTGVRVLGRYLPVPDNRPQRLKDFMNEQEAKGNLKQLPPENGRSTGGPGVDWPRFLVAARKVLEGQ